jgi:hypothetical protein
VTRSTKGKCVDQIAHQHNHLIRQFEQQHRLIVIVIVYGAKHQSTHTKWGNPRN